MKKKTILITLLITITVSSIAFSGCASTQTETNATTQSVSQTTTDSSTYGKVTTVSGNNITLALGTMNQNGGGSPSENSGSTPTIGKSSDPTDATVNTDGTPPTKPADDSQGVLPDMLTLTGETTSLTLTDAITLTKMSVQKPDQQTSDTGTASTSNTTATASDITVGSILKITYATDSTEIESIEIMVVPQTMGTNTETTV